MADESQLETDTDIPSDSPPSDDVSANETPNAVKADRTKQQIEKLTVHNNELKMKEEAARKEAEHYKSLFEASQPIEEQQPIIQPQQPIPGDGLIDENGYVDTNRLIELDRRAKAAEEKALRLEQQQKDRDKQQFEREEKEATLKLYNKYPQLDPLNTEGVEQDGETVRFDPKYYDYVYKELATKAKRGEMPTQEDYMAAADKVYADFYEGREVNKADQEKQTKIEDQKRQINATRPRSPMAVGYYEQDEDEALTQSVRSGKRGAVAEALRRQEERNKS